MPHLYINNKGMPHRKHSFSAGQTFDTSPFKYFLQKCLGWREVNKRARFEFGKALEESIQFFHDNNGADAQADFEQRWSVWKDQQLEYTKTEKDWSSLLRAGKEMLQLYAIRQPTLPIPLGGASVFQRSYSKEVFPGDPNYGGIEDEGRLDIVAYVDPDHPMLPKLDWKPEYGPFRPLIVDIKTSGKDVAEMQGVAALRMQLRRYSWLSGIRDVALLSFIKKGHNIEKGSSITLLKDAGVYKAGQEAVVAYVQNPVKPTKKEPDKQPPMPLGVYLLHNDFMLEEMDKAQGHREDGSLDTTNEAKDKKYAWLREFATHVQESDITRQRLQFNAGYVSRESAEDAGLVAGDQIVAICNSHRRNRWANKFDVAYPHDSTSDPYFRAFVLNDENYRRLNFIKSDEDFDDLFSDDEDA